ncbi:hypothetical protein M409DRAFT_19867 [Zasmidium cellare ATCC 36951]|uniref:WSC domain-containing protein n=1 Tax=Zasmidium cellare ATCC 36951 TaxID=1080233 RepID=A0A6A6CSY8_ZASCE|nr:uncharacterized protein M409DRAFT_19867 [Zasmidium cellare ATCC 36951]KAF2170264.1 hypothetical protein M409DRAFT_19867 [Zasmidium cellare ATCC 36951]
MTYAYVGCYVHTGTRTSTTGLALNNYTTTFAATGNDQCRQRCAAGNWNYFGTVNVGTATVDCWCGNGINYVTSQGGLLGSGQVTGEAGENNCPSCIGGATPGSVPGACGTATATAGTSMAIYARGF